MQLSDKHGTDVSHISTSHTDVHGCRSVRADGCKTEEDGKFEKNLENELLRSKAL